MHGGKAMAARAEIGEALNGRRWTIASVEGAAGLRSLSIQLWPSDGRPQPRQALAPRAPGNISHQQTETRS